MTSVSQQLHNSLKDRYRMEREIARGGMATVYLAKDLRHDRDVALKVMHPAIAMELGRDRFLREIRLTAKLSHPNILTVHDSGEAGDYLWYVMPYVEGESLRGRLESGGTFTVDDTVRLAREAADAIGYAHSMGIVHRDIKPENILLSRGHAVVADFGIARAIDAARDERITTSGIAVGTTAYMSPEQALAEDVDATSDVWALGCVMYEMLAGRPPFGTGGREVVTRSLTGRPDSLRDLRPDTPVHVEQIVDKALAREKTERFANASELSQALDGYLTGQVSLVRSRRRLRSKVPVAAIVVLLVVTGAIMLASRDTTSSGGGDGMTRDSTARKLYGVARVEQVRRTAPSMARAIALYSQAIERDSSFAQAWTQLAATAQIAYNRAYDIPGIPRDSLLALAVAASARAIELRPDDAASWRVKGRVSRLVDPLDNGAALFAIGRSLSLDSTDAGAWFDLGLVQQENLNDSAAVRAWLRSAALKPSDIETLAFLGQHYLWTGQYEKGIRWADSSIRLDPTYQVGRNTAAMLDVALGKPIDAVRHLDAVLRLTKGREKVNPLAMLATAYATLGDVRKARRYIDSALVLFDVKHPVAHEAAYMGAALAAVGDTAAAVRLMSDCSPRGDLHYQLHLKRDPALKWLGKSRGKELLTPDPGKD